MTNRTIVNEILTRPHHERDSRSLLEASGSLGSASQAKSEQAIRAVLIGIGLVVLVLAVFVGWYVAQATGGKDGVKGAANTSAGAQDVLGNTIRDGQFEFRTGELTCGKIGMEGTNYTKPAKGQFCELPVTIENIGNQPRVLLAGLQVAELNNGHKVGLDEDTIEDFSGDFVLPSTIVAGETLKLVFIYDIPVDTWITKLELHDSPLSKGATLTVNP